MQALVITIETIEDVVDVQKLIKALNRQVKIYDERWRVEVPRGGIELVNSSTKIVTREAEL